MAALSEVKARREEIIARELEINAQLAEAKRAYIVDHVTGDFATRVTLEAELAQLAIEKNTLTKALNDAKAATKAYRHVLAHAILIRLVTARGMADLVIESDRLAMDYAMAEN